MSVASKCDHIDHHHHTHHHHHHYCCCHNTNTCCDSKNHPPKQTFRVFCKANPNVSLSIRDGFVILAKKDPSDPHQHWFKEDKASALVKDAQGLPSFALVNKATGQAIQHSEKTHQLVRLVPYNGDGILDGSVLWVMNFNKTAEQYMGIRQQNNMSLHMDAFDASEKKSVHDGTQIGTWEWNGGDNQWWNILPY